MDGSGNTDDMYEYARDCAFLDFCCHSEHIDSFSGGRQCSNDTQWEIIKNGADKYNRDNEFVCLHGYENSETWDANIYFKDRMESYRVDAFGDRLLKYVEEQDAILIPHMTSYPQRQRGYDFNIYKENVVPVMEIYSCHGANEFFGNEYPLAGSEPGGFALDALKRGCKIGFIGAGDGHSCRTGNTKLLTHGYENGLAAIYTNSLTREGVFNAIKNRKCYAVTNSRIIGFMDVNGNKEDFFTDNKDAFVNFSFYGTDVIEYVDIMVNCQRYARISVNNDKIVSEYAITLIHGQNNVYVKARQRDGNYIWLSPLFIELKNKKGIT